MSFFKKLAEVFHPLSELDKAAIKYADAMLDLYVSLMQAHDPTLKKEGIDVKYLHTFLMARIGAQSELGDYKEFELAVKGLTDKAWEVRFAALQILKEMAAYRSGGRELTDVSHLTGHKPIAYDAVVQAMRIALVDPDQRVCAAAEDALKSVEAMEKVGAPA